jgi:hypothetical protein
MGIVQGMVSLQAVANCGATPQMSRHAGNTPAAGAIPYRAKMPRRPTFPHPVPAGLSVPRRTTVLHPTALALLTCAALLATAGCSIENVDRGDGVPAAASAIADPDAGHELHRMFVAEKHDAVTAELPAQF